MKPVPCRFTAQTGIPVFADERMPADRIAVAGLIKRERPGPGGTRIVDQLQVVSVAIGSDRPPRVVN